MKQLFLFLSLLLAAQIYSNAQKLELTNTKWYSNKFVMDNIPIMLRFSKHTF